MRRCKRCLVVGRTGLGHEWTGEQAWDSSVDGCEPMDFTNGTPWTFRFRIGSVARFEEFVRNGGHKRADQLEKFLDLQH